MTNLTRVPAVPLLVNDPYFSIWSCSDRLTDTDTAHWAGARKRISGEMAVDGVKARFLGLSGLPAAEQTLCEITPTATRVAFLFGGVRLTARFTAPFLFDDLDLLSAPVTLIDFALESADGEHHEAEISFKIFDDICYDGTEAPEMYAEVIRSGDLKVGWMGQKRQKLLCHSGDHITIDWGYAYLAAPEGVLCAGDGLVAAFKSAVSAGEKREYPVLAAYDDVASINYFGHICKAWYARGGKTILQAIGEISLRREEVLARCEQFDRQLTGEALTVGGLEYVSVVCASYRQAIGAHKLIADDGGEMVFLSKECDSNGCVGTVDVSYPSIPLFLRYCPDLVRAMCRPIFRFARMPVWTYDFAPHDVGRYPYATGQVYGLNPRGAAGEMGKHGMRIQNGDVYPMFYLYPADARVYDLKYQMPVEECGNMLLMMAAAMRADGNADMARDNLNLLEKWVDYLLAYGRDPGEQLCTDDFAGHLKGNVNLSGKAIMGVAAYAMILEKLNMPDEARKMHAAAGEMADYVVAKADAGDHLALTNEGVGWSMKYNLVWDKLFDLNLIDREIYRREMRYYLERQHRYGLPLDSRKDYTKSDWILWTAALSDEKQEARALIEPVARYLRETPSRVPFSDWYDTKTGAYCHFINRTVQGGLFMPLLSAHWGK